MSWFEYILIALFWAIQIGITVGIALIIGGMIQAIEQLIHKKKGKLLPRAVVMLVLICIILASLTLYPPVTCPKRYEDRITEEQLSAVCSVSRGLYSPNIPLIPAWVEVTELKNFIIDGEMERGVEFTIHYLWFGTVEMYFSTCDGYDTTKPLFGG